MVASRMKRKTLKKALKSVFVKPARDIKTCVDMADCWLDGKHRTGPLIITRNDPQAPSWEHILCTTWYDPNALSSYSPVLKKGVNLYLKSHGKCASGDSL